MEIYNIFFDTEFMENGETIKPISLGFVTETNERLYVVIKDAELSEANDFVKENVIPYIDSYPEETLVAILDKDEAGQYIKKWVDKLAKGRRIAFWANYCAYDWVVFCQLFGKMADLPNGYPMFCNDIQQELRRRGYMRKSDLPELETVETSHNPVYDALGVKERYEWLNSI